MYLNARYYSPYLGRFISPDPLVPEPTSSSGFNRYRYARNNPLRYTDPGGHCEKDENGKYVSRDCVEIAHQTASDWGIGLETALNMDFKYGEDPHLWGGDDRINYKPYTIGDRSVMVGDEWAFEVNYLDAENKDISFSKIVLANTDDAAFANFVTFAGEYDSARQAFRNTIAPIDGELETMGWGMIEMSGSILLLGAPPNPYTLGGGLILLGKSGGQVVDSMADIAVITIDATVNDIPTIRKAQKDSYEAGRRLPSIGPVRWKQ